MREIFCRHLSTRRHRAPGALRRRDPGYSDTSRDAGLLLRPDSTEMVAAICAAASAAGIGIVPQGGLTGWWTDRDHVRQVALSLERMTRILRVDSGRASSWPRPAPPCNR